MKNKASVFLKQIMSLVWMSSVTKAKSMVVKGKLSAAKARLIMFTLMKSKKTVLLGAVSDKINRLLGDKETSTDQDEEEQDQKAIVMFTNGSEVDEDEDKYPDLTHCLFDEEELQLEAETQGGSIIDMVRNSKEEGGEDFSLEDEIDHVADLFITRFYKQMRLQKLLSFKRHQEMLETEKRLARD